MKPSNIQTEVDAAFLYGVLAEHEKDPQVAGIFRQMSGIESSHAKAFLKSTGQPESAMPRPSGRARWLVRLGAWFGYDIILGVLLDTEKSISSALVKAGQEQKRVPSLSDTSHVKILQNILRQSPQISGATLTRFEKRHRSVGGNALRAAVMGGNDGLVSNFSLVMGVAGAAAGGNEVMLAGIAGLLAGALSMALGEWISVKSSQELHENQMELEKEELAVNPEGELHEVALIYQSKGIPPDQAKSMAEELMRDKEKAHAFLVQEELGIQAEDLKGSAMEAAITSFFLFAVGAIIPLLPFFFWKGYMGILVSSVSSAIGLFLIGAAITLFTGRHWAWSGMRQMLFGLAAAAITYGIGSLIGVSLG